MLVTARRLRASERAATYLYSATLRHWGMRVRRNGSHAALSGWATTDRNRATSHAHVRRPVVFQGHSSQSQLQMHYFTSLMRRKRPLLERARQNARNGLKAMAWQQTRHSRLVKRVTKHATSEQRDHNRRDAYVMIVKIAARSVIRV